MKSTRMYTFVLKRKELSKTKEKWPRADCSMTAANSSSGIEEVIPVKLMLWPKMQSRQMKVIRLSHEHTGLAPH
jgi:predicted ATPase